MNVVVTNLDGSTTPYSFDPLNISDIIGFYTKLFWDKKILGFSATSNDGQTISVGA